MGIRGGDRGLEQSGLKMRQSKTSWELLQLSICFLPITATLRACKCLDIETGNAYLPLSLHMHDKIGEYV